jgi:hypothetical protein
MGFFFGMILMPLLVGSVPIYNELQEMGHASMIDIPLVTFDHAEATTFEFHELNDPVMVSSRSVYWYFLLYYDNFVAIYVTVY